MKAEQTYRIERAYSIPRNSIKQVKIDSDAANYEALMSQIANSHETGGVEGSSKKYE